jgi:hypothetical protein
VDADLARNLGTQGYHLRTSDTDVLICHPEMSRHAAQAACLRYLRDILSHFLGEGDLAEVSVHEVLTVSATGLEVCAIDPSRAAAAAAEAEFASSGAPAPPPEGGRRPRLHLWTPFVSSSGRRIQVACELEPVLELRRRTRIGFRVVRTATFIDESHQLTLEDFASLTQRDIVRIDLATIAAGSSAFKTEHPANREASLILPLAVQSLFNIEGRSQVVGAFREARELVLQGVICQLSNVDGVPSSTLLATATLIRPFSLLVIGQVQDDTPLRLARFHGTGLHGLGILAPEGLADHEFAAWAASVIPAAKRAARSVLLYGLGSESQAEVAHKLGATHCSIRTP